MAKLDAFRKLIREEVRAVFQEELAGILKEAVMSNRGQQVITEAPKQKTSIPGTLNTPATVKLTPPSLAGNNPLNAILQETAASMTPKDFEGLSGNADFMTDAPLVESVGDMYASARKSSNLEAIEINTVPDFSSVMEKMERNGQI